MLDSVMIGAIIGFICSVGFLALGYTLGTHSLKEEELDENKKKKNDIINELVERLSDMKEETDDSTESD